VAEVSVMSALPRKRAGWRIELSALRVRAAKPAARLYVRFA
jgi:hypothetical protein